jgi:hypothetical protein
MKMMVKSGREKQNMYLHLRLDSSNENSLEVMNNRAMDFSTVSVKSKMILMGERFLYE